MKGYPVIDETLCTLCGKCVRVCPKEILSISGKAVKISAEECMLCSHCYAVCPEEAISFNMDDLIEVAFGTVKNTASTTSAREMDPALLVRFLRSRRSIRRYRDKPVPDRILKDLIASAVLAPSGSNCQAWEFTVVNGREKVWNIALTMRDFFVKLNRAAANPLIRYLSVPFAGMALVRYNSEHRESVERALAEGEKGHDLLFHGAPALLILHSSPWASLPREDAQYASYNMVLLAHSMGLGSCYIGYASEALNRVPSLKRKLAIPEKNTVYAVLALGYPAVKFERGALRRPWKETWI